LEMDVEHLLSKNIQNVSKVNDSTSDHNGIELFIHCDRTTSIPEWTLLELQGTLESSVSPNIGESSDDLYMRGLCMGDFSLSSKGNPTLQIGNYRLEGKLVNLIKPFVIIKKERINAIGNCSDDFSESETTRYRVVATIRKKYLFASRPKEAVHYRSKVLFPPS